MYIKVSILDKSGDWRFIISKLEEIEDAVQKLKSFIRTHYFVKFTNSSEPENLVVHSEEQLKKTLTEIWESRKPTEIEIVPCLFGGSHFFEENWGDSSSGHNKHIKRQDRRLWHFVPSLNKDTFFKHTADNPRDYCPVCVAEKTGQIPEVDTEKYPQLIPEIRAYLKLKALIEKHMPQPEKVWNRFKRNGSFLFYLPDNPSTVYKLVYRRKSPLYTANYNPSTDTFTVCNDCIYSPADVPLLDVMSSLFLLIISGGKLPEERNRRCLSMSITDISLDFSQFFLKKYTQLLNKLQSSRTLLIPDIPEEYHSRLNDILIEPQTLEWIEAFYQEQFPIKTEVSVAYLSESFNIVITTEECKRSVATLDKFNEFTEVGSVPDDALMLNLWYANSDRIKKAKALNLLRRDKNEGNDK